VHQGHPVSTGIRRVTESTPEKSLQRPVNGLVIGVDPKNFKAKPKLDEIERLLGSVDAGSLRLLVIEPSSRLDRVPAAVARFSELEYAHVAGRALKHYDALFELRKIKSLFVMSYREPSLWPMPELELESFRSTRDSLETCSLSADELWFQSSKLRRFDGGTAKKLTLESCNSLDLDSLANLHGLAELQIMTNTKLPSLDFLGRCPALREISIYASLKDTNVDELKRSRTLTRATIQLTAKRIEEVGVANPRLAITNGVTCFMGGKPARHIGDFYPE
jgi:hypothetical protein